MQFNLSDSFFEEEEGIKLKDGVYFKLEALKKSNGEVLSKGKTL